MTVSDKSINGTVNISPLASACGYIMEEMDSTTVSRLKVSWAILTFPSEILDISRTSLISAIRCLEE